MGAKRKKSIPVQHFIFIEKLMSQIQSSPETFRKNNPIISKLIISLRIRANDDSPLCNLVYSSPLSSVVFP